MKYLYISICGYIGWHWLSFKSEVKFLSRVQLFGTPWIVACQAPLSTEFSRQEYWSGLPFPSLGDLPNPEIGPESPALQTDALPSEPPWWTQTLLQFKNTQSLYYVETYFAGVQFSLPISFDSLLLLSTERRSKQCANVTWLKKYIKYISTKNTGKGKTFFRY